MKHHTKIILLIATLLLLTSTASAYRYSEECRRAVTRWQVMDSTPIEKRTFGDYQLIIATSKEAVGVCIATTTKEGFTDDFITLMDLITKRGEEASEIYLNALGSKKGETYHIKKNDYYKP